MKVYKSGKRKRNNTKKMYSPLTWEAECFCFAEHVHIRMHLPYMRDKLNTCDRTFVHPRDDVFFFLFAPKKKCVSRFIFNSLHFVRTFRHCQEQKMVLVILVNDFCPLDVVISHCNWLEEASTKTQSFIIRCNQFPHFNLNIITSCWVIAATVWIFLWFSRCCVG